MAGTIADYRPERVLADLRRIDELTGGPGGARRVCWTDEWAKAREWLRESLAQLPCDVDVDEAGNLWATIAGEREDVLLVGSHVDSVPNGGWLDGVLGATSALEVMRRYADARPPVTLRFVDWADEEGARFGRSLLGSSAASGSLDVDSVRGLEDRDGIALPDALREHGVKLDGMLEASGRLGDVSAFLEIHIEQGPVLEELGLPAGAVLGTFGVERHRIRFTGRAMHSGSTPMAVRRDAFLAAARFGLECREHATSNQGVATNGVVSVDPGVPTIISGECELTLDMRALDPDALAAMIGAARESAGRIGEEEGVEVEWSTLWQIEPMPFYPELIDLAARACEETVGQAHRLPSGALHDAAEVARRVPTTMLFALSLGGVSHSKDEDTPEPDVLAAARAYGRLAELTMDWLAAPQ